MKDALEIAVEALRGFTAVDIDAHADATRTRVERALVRRRLWRRRVRIALATMGALVLGGGAVAATSLLKDRHPAAPAPAQSMAGPAGVPLPAKATSIAEPPDVPVPAVLMPPPPTSRTAPAATVRRIAKSRGDATVLRTYAAAHAAHFVERNWTEALELWSRYLVLAPSGPLAPEAHWNRGICLIRLGRLPEARAELQRFAEGHWGGYHRAEARKLLRFQGRDESRRDPPTGD